MHRHVTSSPAADPRAHFTLLLLTAAHPTMNLLRLVAAASAVAACSAWVSPGANPPPRPEAVAQDRRAFLARLTVGSAALASSPAIASAAPQEQKDKENIVKGYNRLQYLLDNWEEETTVCKTGQEVCAMLWCFGAPPTILQMQIAIHHLVISHFAPDLNRRQHLGTNASARR